MRPIDRRAAASAAALTLFVLTAASAAPAGEWPRWETPEQAGFSSERLAEAERSWQEIDDAPVAALFLAYKGRRLAAFGDPTATYQCHSVRKSLLSALLGIYVARGAIDLDATLEELGIDDEPPLTAAERQAQVRDLIMARSGVYHEAACETEEMREARPERGSHEPGFFWYYNNWDFNALGTIFRQETGRDVFEAFRTKIARRVGMQDFEPSRCEYFYEEQYSQHPCYVFRMSARDRARFGQLFLQRGRWEGRQVVPEEWVVESTLPYSNAEGATGHPGSSYGYMWWVLSKEFFADVTADRRLHHLWGFQASGYRGQAIYVLPDAEMVLVTAVDVPAGGDLDSAELGPVVETLLTAREIVDLDIRRIQVSDRSATAGDNLRLKVKIRNRGAAATWPTTVDFHLMPVERSGSETRWIGSVDLAAIAAGRSKTVRLATPVSAGLEPGPYRLIASVDSEKANYDLRRDNNVKISRRVLEIR